MDIKKFHNLPTIEDMTKLKNPEVGMCFLTGTKMMYQKELKGLGDMATWYEVVSVGKDGNFSYAPRYGRLTKPTEEV